MQSLFSYTYYVENWFTFPKPTQNPTFLAYEQKLY